MKEIKIIVEEVFKNEDEEKRKIEFNNIMKKHLQNELANIEIEVDNNHNM